MNGELVTKEAFTVIGVSKKGSHHNPMDSQLIASLWEEITKRQEELPGRVDDRFITGICIPPASNDYFYIASVQVNSDEEIPDGMDSFTFPTYEYIKFLHKGSVVNLFQTYRFIWGEWLPNSIYELAEGPELEIVDVKQFPNPYSDDYEMEIYIPVKKKESI